MKNPERAGAAPARAMLVAVALSCAAIAGGARADDAAAGQAMAAYEKAYLAVEVKALCEESGPPDSATMTRISGYIAHQNGFALTAGQSMKAIQNAGSAARKLVKRKGCADPAVQEQLALYRTTLAAAQ